MTLSDEQIKKTWELHNKKMEEEQQVKQQAGQKTEPETKEQHIDRLANERTNAIIAVASATQDVATSNLEIAAALKEVAAAILGSKPKPEEKTIYNRPHTPTSGRFEDELRAKGYELDDKGKLVDTAKK